VKNKGFTLIELMIAMGIIAIVLGLSAGAFKTLLRGASSEKSATETELGKITGLELIRLDLEHTGFGINLNESSLPLEWKKVPATAAKENTLILRTMINNTNPKTLGWALLDVTAGNTPTVITDRRVQTTNNLVLLTQYRQFITNLETNLTSPKTDYTDYTSPPQCRADICRDYTNQGVTGVAATRYIATAFPFDKTVADGCDSTNGGQYCNRITYKLSTLPNPLAKCAAGTQNLIRSVSVGNSSGVRVLECVADFDVRFDWDRNNDGDVFDSNETNQTSLPGTTKKIINNVKNIDMYLLVQAGQRDGNYTFSGDITLNGAINTLDFDPSTATIDPPSAEQKHYRWKVLKISAKPMSW